MAYVVTKDPYRHQVREKIGGKVHVVCMYRTREEADAHVANFRLKNSVGAKVAASQGKVPMRAALEAYKAIKEAAKTKDDDPEPGRIQRWLDDEKNYGWLVGKELGFVTVQDIDDYIILRDDEVSPGTISRELNILRALFKWAKKEYGIRHWENPVEGCNRPSAQDARDRVLSKEEHDRLLNTCTASQSPMLKAAFVLAYETAIRRGELTQILWSDVVFGDDHSYVKLRASTTKTRVARSVPLSATAVAMLREIQVWQSLRSEREEALRARRDDKADVYDFRYVLSGVTPRSIGQAFRKACKAAEVEDMHFHDLRHCATTNLAQHLELVDLMKVTGHKDTKMLARYYNPTGAMLAAKLHASMSAK